MVLSEISVFGRLDQIAGRYGMGLSDIVALNQSGSGVMPLHYSGELIIVRDPDPVGGSEPTRASWNTMQ